MRVLCLGMTCLCYFRSSPTGPTQLLFPCWKHSVRLRHKPVHVTVPAGWTTGSVHCMFQCWNDSSVNESGRVTFSTVFGSAGPTRTTWNDKSNIPVMSSRKYSYSICMLQKYVWIYFGNTIRLPIEISWNDLSADSNLWPDRRQVTSAMLISV